MRYLDLPEIKQLFVIYPAKKIKSAWREILVPEGEYLYTLNRFFAWYYFKAKSLMLILNHFRRATLRKVAAPRVI